MSSAAAATADLGGGGSGGDDGSGEQPEPPDQVVVEVDPTGRYIRFEEQLGRGTFKTVHKAFDELDGIEVAWYQVRIDDAVIMDSSINALDRLKTEIELLASLKHANIMSYRTSWVDKNKKTINIITELFTSGSLRKYRSKHKKVNIKAVKGWAKQILAGLNYLHSQNPPIIHRDLKCDNIFINGNHGEVKIGDFGLATVMKQQKARSVIGTPEFMAPELYDESYNELVDIYSFGMCILEMVIVEYPYSECSNSAQIFKKVTSGIKPAGLSKVDNPEVKAFIEKCLAPSAKRLSARELLQDRFLQLDDSNWSHNMHVEGSEENAKLCKPPADIDAENQPILMSIIEGIGDKCERFTTLVFLKKWNETEFVLKGVSSDTNPFNLVLKIVDRGRGSPRKVDFPFNVDTDTSLSVATEMVEQLELAVEIINVIAELIDSLLINLIPGWKPCIKIGQIVTDGTEKCQDETKDFQLTQCRQSSVESFMNSAKAVNSSGSYLCTDASYMEGSIHKMHVPFVSKDDFPTIKTTSMIETNGCGSEVSYSPANSSQRNGQQVSASILTQDYGYCNGFAKETDVNGELWCVENGSCSYDDENLDGIRKVPAFSGLISNGPVECLDEESELNLQLRFELESIELQYEQAVSEICMRKQQAIASAKRRAAQMKPVSLH